MKEVNKTFSLDQLFISQWTNIKRWVIAPVGLPPQFPQDGLTANPSKNYLFTEDLQK